MSSLTPLVLNVLRYLLIAGGAFFIFYKVFPNYFSIQKIQLKSIKKKDIIREVLYSSQTTAVISLLGILIVSSPLGVYTHIYTTIDEYPIWWIPISIMVMLIFHDTYFYWMHRIVHHPKWFRSIHLIHHKSTNP
jgi:sterol desaturase/sphingolipid hydroxylase (fatty acid hydroxylase superfamily)